MASNITESAFQKRMLDAFHQEHEKTHAWKAARMWAVMAGLPDLYVKHPNYPAVWIELKVTGGVELKLSPLQRHFIKREQQAGGHAGWCVLSQKGEYYTIYAGSDTTLLSIPSGTFCTVSKQSGGPLRLDVTKILERMIIR